MVISGVADAVPDKIASLIYLDAFVPEDGQSLFGMLPPDRPHTTAPGEEWLTAPLPVEAFGKASQQVRDFIARKGMSQPTACFSQPVKLTGGIDRISRKSFIYCNDPEPTGVHALLREAQEQARLDRTRPALLAFRTDGHARGANRNAAGDDPKHLSQPTVDPRQGTRDDR